MIYQALYRVWRPQRFDDVIGQPLITKTLKNAVKINRISHAYLFAGTRGTGKTSMAKIFAKAINCRFQQNGEPCNECDACKTITTGTSNDVIEIDAASNNGIEEIRDIRDKVKYAPIEFDYKVYIIDEVHMLSTGAFNALLKTLEEPPTNVIFILATTNQRKIPVTIISRTQLFEFKPIKIRDSLSRMVTILKYKKIDYDPKALKVIANAAEGGMRDALSILDQIISFSDSNVTLENALQVTGTVRQSLLVDYMIAVTKNHTKEGLITIHKILADGKDPKRFIEDLINVTRNLLLYQQAPEIVEDIELNQMDNKFKQLSDDISEKHLYKMIYELTDIQKQMLFTTHKDVYLEVLTVKLSGLYTSTAIVSMGDSQKSQYQIDTKHVSKPTLKPLDNVSINLQKIYLILQQATKDSLIETQQNWSSLNSFLSVTQRAMMHALKPVAASPQGVIIACDYTILLQRAIEDQELIDALQNGFEQLIGKIFEFFFVPSDEWLTVRKNFIQQYKAGKISGIRKNTLSVPEQSTDNVRKYKQTYDPVIIKAQDLFGDDIIEIRKD